MLPFLLAGCADPAAPAPDDPTVAGPAGPLAVVLNEIAPAAARSGPGSDWIELYAASDVDVSLEGWTLADATHPPVPLSGVVPARGVLVLPAPVALDADGDVLVLGAPDGGTDRVVFDATSTDLVWARGADACAGDCWEAVWMGTPGASNGLVGVRTADLEWTGPTDATAWFEADTDAVDWLDLTFTTADGVEVFVDGEEVARDGLPSGSLAPETPPTGERASATTRVRIPPSRLLPGTQHVVVVRLHALSTPGPFSLSLGVRGPFTPEIPDPPPSAEAYTGDAPDAAVWEAARIHTVDVDVSDADWALLDAEVGTYVEGTVTFDGHVVDRVGVKRRGKGGSLRPMSGKPKLRLDFDRAVDGTFLGNHSLLLDNAVQDCSWVKMPVSFEVFRLAGNPAPRSAYARVRVNGVDKGLYYLTEELDQAFTADRFGDGDAVVFDGSYPNKPGEPLLLTDFRWERLSWFDQEEGGPNTVLEDLTTALDAWEQGTGSYAAVGDVLDWGSWHAHQAAERWVGHVDGYVLMPNNYWLVTPADGRTRIVAWDTDQTFVRDFEWFIGTRWNVPGGRVTELCLRDAACAADHEAALRTLEDTLAASDLRTHLEVRAALTLAETQTDPLRECAAESVEDVRNHVRRWLDERTAELAAGGG